MTPPLSPKQIAAEQKALCAAMETGSQVPSEAIAALHEIPDGTWLAPNELTQPMLAAAGFIAEDNSNRKRWELFKMHAPKVECTDYVKVVEAGDTVAVPKALAELAAIVLREGYGDEAAEISRLLDGRHP